MKAYIYLLVILSGFSSLFSAEVRISPEKITAGRSVQIFNSSFQDTVGLYVYNDESFQPKYYEFSGQESFTFLVPDNTVYLSLQRGELLKNYIIYDNNGTPKESSYYFESLNQLANLEPIVNPLMNYSKALSALESEIKFHPNNYTAQIAYLSVKYDTKAIAFENYDSSLALLIKKVPITDERSIIALSKALNTVSRTNEADSILKEAIRQNPRGKSSEENYIYTMENKEDSKDYLEISDLFLRLFPTSEKRDQVIRKAAQILINEQKYDECETFLETNDFSAVDQALYLAFSFLEKQNSQPKAEKFIHKLITYYEVKEKSLAFSNLTPDKRNETINNLAEIYRAFGEMYFQIGDKDNSLKYFKLAEEKFTVLPSALYEDLAAYYYKYRFDDLAEEVIIKSIIESKSNNKLINVFEKLYSKSKYGKSYDDFIDSLNFEAKIRRQEALKKSRLQIPFKYPVLLNPDGLMVDMSIYKGEVMVMDLFASWCEPCEKSFNSLISIADNLNFRKTNYFQVNIWENKQLDKEVFAGDDFGKIRIMLDEKNEIPISTGIKGIPIRLFIDKAGNISYVITGAIGKDEDINSTIDILEILTKD